jgi:hypothetical protein
MENIDLEDALNAGAYHPEGTSKSYFTFFNKFAAFVGNGKYVHGDMKILLI